MFCVVSKMCLNSGFFGGRTYEYDFPTLFFFCSPRNAGVCFVIQIYCLLRGRKCTARALNRAYARRCIPNRAHDDDDDDVWRR